MAVLQESWEKHQPGGIDLGELDGAAEDEHGLNTNLVLTVGILAPCATLVHNRRVTVTVEEEVAMYINNKKRRDLLKMEDDHEVQVVVVSREDLSPEFLKFDCEDGNGREVRVGDI